MCGCRLCHVKRVYDEYQYQCQEGHICAAGWYSLSLPHKNCNDWVNQIKLDELTVLLLDHLDMKSPGGHGLSGLG